MFSEKAVSCAATCLLLMFSGSTFALGVLATAAASDQAWESSIATMALVSAPAMILAGLYLDKEDSKSKLSGALPIGTGSEKTKRTRLLTAFGGLGFAALSLGSTESPSLIRFAVSVQGFPLGILYLLGNELLANWMREAPGLGIGIGQTAFGFGTILSSSLFAYLMTYYGRISIAMVAIILAVPTWLVSCFIHYPNYEPPHLPTENGGTVDETTSLLGDPGVRISWKMLLSDKSFWLYMAIVCTAQAGFAFTPFFFEIGTSFGKPMVLVVFCFQVGSLLGTLGRLASGVLADVFRFGTSGHFWSGSKNLLQLVFLAQAALFAALIILSNREQFLASMVAAIALLVTYSSANCCCTTLARDLFSRKNSATVFGVGGGLMMGVGEAVAAGMASWLVGKYGGGPKHSGFTMYYAIATVWSLAGLLFAMTVKKSRFAFKTTVTSVPVLSADELPHPVWDSEGFLREETVTLETPPMFPLYNTCAIEPQPISVIHTVGIAT